MDIKLIREALSRAKDEPKPSEPQFSNVVVKSFQEERADRRINALIEALELLVEGLAKNT